MHSESSPLALILEHHEYPQKLCWDHLIIALLAQALMFQFPPLPEQSALRIQSLISLKSP